MGEKREAIPPNLIPKQMSPEAQAFVTMARVAEEAWRRQVALRALGHTSIPTQDDIKKSILRDY